MIEAHDAHSSDAALFTGYALLLRPQARKKRDSVVCSDALETRAMNTACGGASDNDERGTRCKRPALRSSFELALLRMVAEVGEFSTMHVLHAASVKRKSPKPTIGAKGRSEGSPSNQSHGTKRPVPGKDTRTARAPLREGRACLCCPRSHALQKALCKL